MGRTIDPDETQVAWFPEENAYRVVRHKIETVTVGGEEHAFEVAEVGGLVTWIDEAPQDPEDGSGHFEAHHGAAEHYRSVKPAGGTQDGEE